MNLQAFWHGVLKFFETAWIPALEVLIGVVLGPRVKKLVLKMTEKSPDKGVMTFIGSAANILIIGISILLAAESLGVKMNSIIALISALGLGIALALRGNMSNVACGIQILITKPFMVGEYIQADGYEGTVKAIELMYTTIYTAYKEEIIVPNSTIVSDTIVNFSRQPLIKMKINFTVEYEQGFASVFEKARQIVESCSLVDHSTPVEIEVDSIGEDYASLYVLANCKWQDYNEARRQVLKALALGLPCYNSTNYNDIKIDLTSLPASLVQKTEALAQPAEMTSAPDTAKPAFPSVKTDETQNEN